MARHSVGDEIEPFEDQPLRIEDFVRYQGASGDFNPIHYDTEYAEAAGFERPFAVGMRQAGVAASWLCANFGPESVRRFTVQWRQLAWPGDVLTYAGVVTDVRDLGPREVDVDFSVTRRDGSVHIRGTATVLPHHEGETS